MLATSSGGGSPSAITLTGLSVVASLLLTAATFGCGDDSGGSSPLAPGDPPRIELIDAGDTPQRQLLLNPRIGDELSAELTMEMGLSVAGEEQRNPDVVFPRVTLDTTATVTDVGDGAITLDYEFEGTRIADVAGSDAVRARLEASFAGLEGVRGSLVMTRTGALLDLGLAAAPVSDPAVGQVLSQLEQQAESITAPFPAEPVGEGAAWSARSAFEVRGIASVQETTYTLEELRGDDYALAVEYEHSVQPGEIEGAQGVSIRDGTVSGQGWVTGSLAFPMPTSSQLNITGETAITTAGPDGEAVDLDQYMEMSLTLAASDE